MHYALWLLWCIPAAHKEKKWVLDLTSCSLPVSLRFLLCNMARRWYCTPVIWALKQRNTFINILFKKRFTDIQQRYDKGINTGVMSMKSCPNCVNYGNISYVSEWSKHGGCWWQPSGCNHLVDLFWPYAPITWTPDISPSSHCSETGKKTPMFLRISARDWGRLWYPQTSEE